MKYKFTFLLVLLSGILCAQVQLVAEQDQERNLTIFAFNKADIPYTVQIRFTNLENLESLEGDLLHKLAKPGKSTLVKLQSIYGNENTAFSYTTKLFKGDIKPSVPFSNPYLIPVEEGISVSMRPLVVDQRIPENRRYTGVGFFFSKPEKVCAPRKGVVSELKMDLETVSSGLADFSSENYVEIYHQDGSFTRLSGLKANSAKVTVGETVFPGQEIAESSPETKADEYHVKMIQSRWEMEPNGVNWINFPVSIYSGYKNYVSELPVDNLQSVFSNELITKEMDKKELKKFSGK